MKLIKVKELKRTVISDVKKLNNLFICRSNHEVFALDSESLDVVWTTKIAGDTKIDLDKILIFNDNIVVFSSDKTQGKFHIYSLDVTGNVNWNVLSDVRPIDNLGITELDGNLIYRAYNSEGGFPELIKLSLTTGEQVFREDLKVKVNYVVRKDNDVFLLGVGGTFQFKDNSVIKVSSEEVISVFMDSDRIYYLAFFGEKGKYKLHELALVDGENNPFIAEVELDNADRSFMTPLIRENSIIQSAGKKNGAICKNLVNNETVWDYRESFILLSFLPFIGDNIALFTMDETYRQKVTLLNALDGTIPCEIPYEDDPVYIYSIDETLFVGGFNSIEVIKVESLRIDN